jgi:hypothetical protein
VDRLALGIDPLDLRGPFAMSMLHILLPFTLPELVIATEDKAMPIMKLIQLKL